MKIEVGERYLITTDSWFVAPDGNTYHAVYGTVKRVETAESALGFRPRGRSANWFVEIGDTIVAGCQIHFAVRTDECFKGRSSAWEVSAEHGLILVDVPSRIWFADEEKWPAREVTRGGSS